MKTLVIGASTNPERYSFKAIQALLANGHEVIALSNRNGSVSGIDFQTEKKPFNNIHTVTLYINPVLQKDFQEYIVSLGPQRVIFNPGTENPAFEELLTKNGIEPIEACTLVMLATRQF